MTITPCYDYNYPPCAFTGEKTPSPSAKPNDMLHSFPDWAPHCIFLSLSFVFVFLQQATHEITNVTK